MIRTPARRLFWTVGVTQLCFAPLSKTVMGQEKPARWADAGTGSVLVQGVWGAQTTPGDVDSSADAYQSSTPYAFGIGVSAGYTFPFKLHLGARVGHHFGRDGYDRYYPGPGLHVSNGMSRIGEEGGDITGSEQSTHFGTEVGYDFVVGPVVIRPYLADGLLVHADEECYPQACESFDTNELFVGMGASVFGIVGPILIGLDSTFIAPLNDSSINAGLFSIIAGLQLPP
jgi:hypothetical protein